MRLKFKKIKELFDNLFSIKSHSNIVNGIDYSLIYPKDILKEKVVTLYEEDKK